MPSASIGVPEWSMSLPLRRSNRSAGFTLGEVLVALAIAAMLAAMLTRFVAGTRFNAARVAELVEMETLSQSMLERISAQDVRAGRIDGRRGDFAWRIEIVPLDFAAQARRVSRTPNPAAEAGQSQRAGFTPISSSSFGSKSDLKPSPAASVIPFHITLVIEARSGRKHETDTIRIGPARTGEP